MQHVRRGVAEDVLPRRGRVPRDVGPADGAGALGRASRSSTSGLAAALRRGARLRLLPQRVERRDDVGSALLTICCLTSAREWELSQWQSQLVSDPRTPSRCFGTVGQASVRNAERAVSGRGSDPMLSVPASSGAAHAAAAGPTRAQELPSRPQHTRPSNPDSSWGSAATRHDAQPSCA